ncbi:MAG TPA: DNA polymerase III subunit delta' [Stellaceae bacterium]|jgi:DNA polymerase-3 subunit delta'|nr:DNA polymerase III subunit delta' [Stellaceae bacterium]
MKARREPPPLPDAAAPPAPRANPDLIGHEAAETTLRQLFESGRMPHALLLSGPRGIGKATLAFRLARFVLATGAQATLPRGFLAEAGDEDLAIPPEGGVFRRIASGGHADLLTVERAYDPRRRRLRNDIVVDNTREISTFLRLTPAEGGWRVVIVDGADDMNRNAANALLKILEEPPRRTLLLLVAHSPGRLLPTIRSRCRRFPLAPLTPAMVRQLLARYRPDLPTGQAETLIALSGGSIGRALELAGAGGVELYETVLALVSSEKGNDAAALHGFADRLARGEAEDSYRAVEELLGRLLVRLAIGNAGREADAELSAPAAETALLHRFAGRAPAARWAELHDEIGQSFARTDALNLDRKQTILGAFFAIEAAAR